MVTLLIRNAGESQALLQLALRAARGLGRPLSLLLLTRQTTEQVRALKEKDPVWMQELNVAGVAEVMVCGGAQRHDLAEGYLKQNEPRLLILGKHLSAHAETEDAHFSRHLYDSLACQTLLVRLTNNGTDIADHMPVLVSCGGGPHTTRALKLAHAIAGRHTVALHSTADVDAVSTDQATARLHKILRRAGLSPDEVICRIVLGTNIPAILRHEVETATEQGRPYSMLLLGYSPRRGMRGKLFSTLPDSLINKTGLSLAVIRASRPVSDRVKSFFGRRIRLSIPQLEREERIALFEEIESKSVWSFDFATLMTLAALVAGLGLLANSGAVVIGAMLIAPLMMPLIGSGLALAQGHSPLFRNAFLAVIRGFLAALVTGLLLGLLARTFHIPLTGELAARGNPSLLDLGIAFVSGIAASYCIARPNLTGALAGVAIAAALVPPIVTTGICLTLGEMEVAMGAGLLFGTNVVAVILGAALNFILAGIYGQGRTGEHGRRFIIILALACLGLAVPLTSVLLRNIPQLEETLTHLPAREERLRSALPPGARLDSMSQELRSGHTCYELVISAPYQLTPEHVAHIRQVLAETTPDTAVKVQIENKIVLGDVPLPE